MHPELPHHFPREMPPSGRSQWSTAASLCEMGTGGGGAPGRVGPFQPCRTAVGSVWALHAAAQPMEVRSGWSSWSKAHPQGWSLPTHTCGHTWAHTDSR